GSTLSPSKTWPTKVSNGRKAAQKLQNRVTRWLPVEAESTAGADSFFLLRRLPHPRLRRYIPMNGEEPPPHEWGGYLTTLIRLTSTVPRNRNTTALEKTIR